MGETGQHSVVATCNIYYLGQAETEQPDEYGLLRDMMVLNQ